MLGLWSSGVLGLWCRWLRIGGPFGLAGVDGGGAPSLRGEEEKDEEEEGDEDGLVDWKCRAAHAEVRPPR